MTTISDSERLSSLLESRGQRPAWGVVPEALRPSTPEEGYRLQRLLYAAMAAKGRPTVGYKIGCTAPSSRAPFGLDQPIYAGIFAHTRWTRLDEALAIPLVKPLIECEIAVRIGTDFAFKEADDEMALLKAIEFVYAACEIVDARYGGSPANIGVPTLLVDDFLHAGFVLGEPIRATTAPLAAPKARLHVEDKTYSVPVPDTLPPLQALLWLARKLKENGDQLRAGDIVLTGSILNPVPISCPVAGAVAIAIEGIGTLTAPGGAVRN